MSRISEKFKQLETAGQKALIPYIAAGDPHPDNTVDLMHGLVKGGADIIELGVPFSDPMADGPVIQLAHERALSQGVTLTDVLTMVSTFRQTDNVTPVVLMGYLNPIEVMGYEQFASQAAEAGVDGVLVVDLPPEEAASMVDPLAFRGIDTIFLLAPTTTESRIKTVCEHASGYLYYVSLKGVTGADALNTDAVSDRVELIKSYTDLPISVGFGIRDGDAAAKVAAIADGVVIGSVLVDTIARHQTDPNQAVAKLSSCLEAMRMAMDA